MLQETFILVNVLLIIIPSYLFTSDFIECMPNRTQLDAKTILAKLYLMLHMSLIIVAAVQMEQVFYAIPKKMGYFDLINHTESAIGLDQSEKVGSTSE
jgi:hypothetical protein